MKEVMASEPQSYVNEANQIVVSHNQNCFLLSGHTHNVYSLEARRIGSRLLLVSAGQIGRRRHGAILWNLEQHHPFAISLLPSSPSWSATTALSHDGTLATVAFPEEPIRVWRVPFPGTVQPPIEGPVIRAAKGVAFSLDAQELAVVDTSEPLRRFRLSSGRLQEIPHAPPIRGRFVAYDRMGNMLVVTENGMLRIDHSNHVAPIPTPDLASFICTRLTADASLLLTEQDSELRIQDVQQVDTKRIPLRPSDGGSAADSMRRRRRTWQCAS